jgi:hypothetical protein
MKDKEPPFADISPGGRALRAAKSKTKHFKSFLQMGIDAATVAGNEREAHHLKEARALLSNEAHNDVTADPQKVAADLNKSLLTAAFRAHPAHRAAFAAIRQVGSTEARKAATAPARAARADKLTKLMTAVQDEIDEKRLVPTSGVKFASRLYEGVRKRLGVTEAGGWPTVWQIRGRVRAIIKIGQSEIVP